MIDPRLQEVERRFRPIIFDALPRPMQKLAMNTGSQHLWEVDDAFVLT